MERRRSRRIENFKFVAEHFDTARNQGGVLSAFWASTDNTHYLETVLIAAVVGRRKDLGAVRIANDLNKTFAIAEVNEDHAAVVAATVGPTVEGHSLADEGLVDQARVHGSHKSSLMRQGCKSCRRSKTTKSRRSASLLGMSATQKSFCLHANSWCH
jgi:hypothetical protein